MVAWGVWLGAPVAVAAAGGGCPTEEARAETGSGSLPDCRAYELVSPAEKNGGQAGGNQESAKYGVAGAGGEAVAYESLGSFGSTPTGFDQHSLSRRYPAGWATSAVLPRGQGHLRYFYNHVEEFNPSPDFSRFFFLSLGPFVGAPDAVGDPNAFVAGGDPFVEPEWASRPGIADPAPALGNVETFRLGLAGGSPSFGTVFFTYNGTLTAQDAPRQENPVFESELKEYANTGLEYSERIWGFYVWSGGVLRSAGVLPDGSTSPWGAVPAATDHAVSTEFSPDDFDGQVSEDGSRAFFVSPDPHAQELCVASGYETVHTGGCVPQLYVREVAADGSGSTVLVSRDEGGQPAAHGPLGLEARDPCGGACRSFVFGSPDGSQAFFESVGSLVAGAPVNGLPKMYDFDVDTGSITYLPGVAGTAGTGKPGEDGSVVLASAADGLGFLFEKVEEGRPVALGVWSRGEHPGGTVRTIAALPEPVERNVIVHPARSTVDGSVFVFETDSPLVGFNDGGGFEQVYRYDVSSRALSCVSCPPGGVAPSGDARLSEDDNQGGSDQGVGEGSLLGSRGLSEDGSMVFFDSPDPLVPQDINGKRDVYEWDDGVVHLITSGESPNESFFVDNSASGRDVFFATTSSFVPSDTDGGYDIYDARVGGGFSQPAVPASCSGDGCRGPVGVSGVLGAPAGSATLTGGANVSPVVTNVTVKHSSRKKPKKKAKGRKGRNRGKLGKKATRRTALGKRAARRAVVGRAPVRGGRS